MYADTRPALERHFCIEWYALSVHVCKNGQLYLSALSVQTQYATEKKNFDCVETSNKFVCLEPPCLLDSLRIFCHGWFSLHSACMPRTSTAEKKLFLILNTFVLLHIVPFKWVFFGGNLEKGRKTGQHLV